MRRRLVTIKYGDFVKTYAIDSDGTYSAKMKALDFFLKEFGIPGRPVHYLTRKKHLMDISVRLEFDKRKFRTVIPSSDYNIYLIEQLQKSVGRRTDLPDKNKNEATKLLLRLQEVLQ